MGSERNDCKQYKSGCATIHLVSRILFLAFLHRRSNAGNSCYSHIVNLIHIACGVARCIACKLTLVQRSDELADGIGCDIVVGKLLADILARQLFDGHAELVAHITPQSSQHLIVEVVGTTRLHQRSSLLQSFRSHLVSLAGTLFHDVGVLNSTATEDDKQRDKGQQQHAQCQPVGRRTEEELALQTLAGSTGLDVTDIVAQLTHVFLTTERGNGIGAVALGNLKLEALGVEGLVSTAMGIEVNVLDGRDLKSSLMTRHGQEVVADAALQAIDGQLGIVCHLSIVDVEVLGELDDGLLEQFHVANTADNNVQLDGIVSLDLSLFHLCRDAE